MSPTVASQELDSPGEFFFDKGTGKLYLFHNGTGAPPADAAVVAPQMQVLLNMSGSQWAPVTGVSLEGITYTASAYTYMEPHGVPSAGDCETPPDLRVRAPRPRPAFALGLGLSRWRGARARRLGSDPRVRRGPRALCCRLPLRHQRRHNRQVLLQPPGRQRCHALRLQPQRNDFRLRL